ncbi:MAG: polysaccharide deacetylase [Ruminococcaceae bacterium]|nr:polysaccharide deacetylase [Oscillospiraceae bacterium]
MKKFFGVIKLKSMAVPLVVLALSTVLASPVLNVIKADANAEKTVYFTFDDGPSEVTEEILDILKEKNIKATFFVIGPSGDKTDERIYRIFSEGHTIGLHTMSHDYDKIYSSPKEFMEDIEYERSWVYSVTGEECKIFRFPGGSMNSTVERWFIAEVTKEAEEKDYIWYDWNADAKDSLGRLLSPEEIAENVLSSEAVGAGDVIVLMHDSSTRTTAPQALRILIDEFEKMGYSFDKLG